MKVKNTPRSVPNKLSIYLFALTILMLMVAIGGPSALATWKAAVENSGYRVRQIKEPVIGRQ